MKKALTALCAVTFSLAALSGCSSTEKKKADCQPDDSKAAKSSCCCA